MNIYNSGKSEDSRIPHCGGSPQSLLKMNDTRLFAGGISRSTALRWSKDPTNTFPMYVKTGPNSIAWKLELLLEWRNNLH